MARLPSFDPIDFLVGREYNLARGGGYGASYQTPEERAASEARWQELEQQATAYRRALEQKSESEINQMVEEARASDRRRQAEAEERAEAAHPFNNAEALATPEVYAYWCKARYWGMDEATALLIGRNPKHISKEKASKDRRASKIAAHFLETYELVERAFRHIWRKQSVAPSAYVQWALNIGLPVPKELLDAFAARGQQITEWSQERTALKTTIQQLREQIDQLEQEAAATNVIPSPKSLGTRERESLLKLVIGMAIDGYGFDPKAGRSPTPRELSDHLQTIGISLSDDTIRAYLNEAKELLPGDEP